MSTKAFIGSWIYVNVSNDSETEIIYYLLVNCFTALKIICTLLFSILILTKEFQQQQQQQKRYYDFILFMVEGIANCIFIYN